VKRVEIDSEGFEEQSSGIGRNRFPHVDTSPGHVVPFDRAFNYPLRRPNPFESVYQAVGHLHTANEVEFDRSEPSLVILRPPVGVHLLETLARYDSDEFLEID